MCTLVVAARTVPGFPLVVIANRDEHLDRASSPPMLWPDVPGKARFIAPRDEVAGGSWLGWNEHGVFVGITNRFDGPRDPTRTSRGGLVLDALGERSAAAIHARMARLDPTKYNGFHLVYADAKDVLATVGDGATLAQLTFGDGIAIVTERSFASGADARRTARIRAAWQRVTSPAFDPGRATMLLTEHDHDPSSATCLHLDELRYGTRSSMVLTSPRNGPPALAWAEGAPCRTPFHAINLAF